MDASRSRFAYHASTPLRGQGVLAGIVEFRRRDNEELANLYRTSAANHNSSSRFAQKSRWARL